MKIRVEWTTPEDNFSKTFTTYQKALDFYTGIRDGEDFWSTIEMWRLDTDEPELLAVEEKSNHEIMKQMNQEEDLSLREEFSDDIEKFINDIYELRRESIANEGEYGLGNLVFKEFRNRGYLDYLKDLRKEEKGKELSLEHLEEELVSDEDAFWNIRDTISKLASDKYDEVNLILDDGKIRPATKKELANKFAISIEHADTNDFKTREEIEEVANKYGADKIMFFIYKGLYGGEYSLLFSGEDAENKVKEIKNKYNQEEYASYDSDGNYHPSK